MTQDLVQLKNPCSSQSCWKSRDTQAITNLQTLLGTAYSAGFCHVKQAVTVFITLVPAPHGWTYTLLLRLYWQGDPRPPNFPSTPSINTLLPFNWVEFTRPLQRKFQKFSNPCEAFCGQILNLTLNLYHGTGLHCRMFKSWKICPRSKDWICDALWRICFVIQALDISSWHGTRVNKVITIKLIPLKRNCRTLKSWPGRHV